MAGFYFYMSIETIPGSIYVPTCNIVLFGNKLRAIMNIYPQPNMDFIVTPYESFMYVDIEFFEYKSPIKYRIFKVLYEKNYYICLMI